MTAISSSVFANSDVHLRVWFNDGSNGSQLLTPDQRIAAVGYTMVASTVVDGAITSEKLADDAVTTAKIANDPLFFSEGRQIFEKKIGIFFPKI